MFTFCVCVFVLKCIYMEFLSFYVCEICLCKKGLFVFLHLCQYMLEVQRVKEFALLLKMSVCVCSDMAVMR